MEWTAVLRSRRMTPPGLPCSFRVPGRPSSSGLPCQPPCGGPPRTGCPGRTLSLIHISEPTRLALI
eukprot:4758160-Alexandrium_andersonii.AAC.1